MEQPEYIKEERLNNWYIQTSQYYAAFFFKGKSLIYIHQEGYTDWEKQATQNVYYIGPILLKTKQNKNY